MLVHEYLEKIGLNEKEAKVYVAVLGLGASSVAQIAKKSGIKRTTVYEILDPLKEQGLVSETIKGKKRLFVAAEPEDLTHIVERKNQLLEEVMPILKGMSQTTKTRPRVRVYQGTQEIKQIYMDTLKEGKDIYGFVDMAAVAPEIASWYPSYIKRRIKAGIRGFAIFSDSPEAQKFKQQDEKELRESRVIASDKYPFSMEINIYGNKVAFISYRTQELLGVLVESQEIAKTMKSVFDLAWDNVQ